MEALIFLDTHVLVWLYASGPDLMSEAATKKLSEDDLLISPIVLLELEYLREVGRLEVSSQEVYTYLHTRLGLKLCTETFAPVVQSSVAQTWTRDPFDRLIVGHAAVRGLPLLTRDRLILENYEKAVWEE